MDRWVGFAAGMAASLVVVGVLQWVFRRDRRRRYTVGEYLAAFGIVLPFMLARIVWAPELSRFTENFVIVAQMGVVFGIALVITHVRSVRAERRDADDAAAARAAVPTGAAEYYASPVFRRELSTYTDDQLPTPEAASDLVGYWAYMGLTSGDIVEWSRVIHHATVIRGMLLSSPSLAAAIPALVAPFLSSGDKTWDPEVDRAFRRTALNLLTTRFGTSAPQVGAS